jgi:integrase/recombinase XerD
VQVRTGEATAWLLALGLAPKTARLYARNILAAESWCAARGLDLATLPGEQVVELAASKPLSHSSRTILRAALRHYWERAGRDAPPLRAIRVPPEPTHACRALEEDDARILAKAARARGDRKGLAVILGLYQALRREEIATLPWSAMREEGWLRVVGKGSKERRIPLHPITAEALAWVPEACDFVFPGRFGGPVTPATIWAWVREVSEEAGAPMIPPHVLRHTSLATANDGTGDLRAVQAFACHSKPETTSRYTRATARRLAAVVSSLDY